ncbi:MAG: hypothetical protein E6R04_08660 [Spirochaetes bacterium]|nr:MAG: hypothetical protein E6R04_08660 [Spirochaetota bacterium]
MSVTFSHTAEPIISGWVMECGCGEWRSAEFPSYEEVVGSRANGCTDEFCASYPAYPTPCYVGVEPLSANFSNMNARHLLSLLGIHDEDLCGSMDVDEFERALALAVPTEGKPSLVTRFGGRRARHRGRRAAGLLRRQLRRLRTRRGIRRSRFRRAARGRRAGQGTAR